MRLAFRFSFLWLISLLLSSCHALNSSSDQNVHLGIDIPRQSEAISTFATSIEAFEWEENFPPTINHSYRFVEVSSEASCVQVELFDDESGVRVDLPDFIQQGDLTCVSSANQISPNGQWVSYHVYDEETGLSSFEVYNHMTQKRVVLDAEVKPSSGRSCFWRSDDLALACVSVYEKQVDGLEKTTLYLFELSDMGDLEKTSFFTFPQDQMIHFGCGSLCFVDENDLYFSKNHSILYRGHLEIVPDQFFSIEY